jgi:hypothetical protein
LRRGERIARAGSQPEDQAVRCELDGTSSWDVQPKEAFKERSKNRPGDYRDRRSRDGTAHYER